MELEKTRDVLKMAHQGADKIIRDLGPLEEKLAEFARDICVSVDLGVDVRATIEKGEICYVVEFADPYDRLHSSDADKAVAGMDGNYKGRVYVVGDISYYPGGLLSLQTIRDIESLF